MDQNLVGSRGGTLMLVKGKLAIGDPKFNVTGTLNYVIDGIMYNSTSPGSNNAFSTGHTALGNQEACVFGVWIDSSNVLSTTQGPIVSNTDVTAGKTVIPLPAVVDAKALVGLIKVRTAVATFTPGTTCTNATNITSTKYDTFAMPVAPFTS